MEAVMDKKKAHNPIFEYKFILFSGILNSRKVKKTTGKAKIILPIKTPKNVSLLIEKTSVEQK